MFKSPSERNLNAAQSSPSIAEMYVSFLVDKQLKLSQKVKLLDLLYFFTDTPAPYTLKTYLAQFVAQLPLKSSELTKGEPIYNDYVNSMRKIFVALELSLSADVLTLIVNVICRERKHLLDAEIQLTIVRFVQRLDAGRQATLLATYWDSVLGGGEHVDDERRQIVFDKVLFEIARACTKPVFIDLVSAQVVFLFELLDTELKEASFEAACSNRIWALRFIDLAYKRLLKDEIFSSSARLCVAYETKKFGTFSFNLILRLRIAIRKFKGFNVFSTLNYSIAG